MNAKTILLALALTLGTTAAVVPSAFACGGSYAVERPEERAVREAVLTRLRDRFADRGAVWVAEVHVDGEHATARLVVSGEDRYESHDVRLRMRRGAWRVLSVSRAQA